MPVPSLLIATASGALAVIPANEAAADTQPVGDDGAASAQEGSSETGSARTRRVFTPADFERFAPRSALDMAEQIPGFTIRSSGGNRGLGQADTNVIINGQRISGKSNGPVEALQRIPAEEVVRLEIVDGASLDIGGLTGQVLNVITRSTGGVTGQFRYSAEWRSFGVPFRWGDGQISLAGGGENTEWTLSFENDAARRGNEGIERVFDAEDIVIDTRDEQANFNFDRPTLSGSFARTAANGNILNVTGSVGGNIRRNSEVSLRTGLIDPIDRVRTFTSDEDEFNYEIGADYAFSLGGGQLKLIGYNRYEDSPTKSTVITSFADGSPSEGSVFRRDADEGETILRGEYTFGALGGDVQLALEGVRNFLDIDSSLEERDDAGELQPIQFEGATARVEEDRAETSVTYSRALAPSLQMQLSLGGEYSQISQTGPAGLTRTFYRPKGFAALDWKANSTLNLSGRVERVVGQLNFFDFIATTDLDQDRVDVTNANLVPPQSWLFEVEATQDLSALGLGALGSLNLRAFHEEISDIVDQIPIAGGGEAPGNIDAATESGIEAELTLLFDPIGVNGLRLDAEVEWADSEVLDPLLGTPRSLSDFEFIEVDVDLRKDFIGSPWAVGASYSFDEDRPSVRLNEISRGVATRGFARVFVEHKDVFGMTARFRVGNLLDQRDNFDRTIFIDRVAGLVDFREERRRRFGTIYSIDIEGSF
ncbi:TonB-dependent receptor plug domain-containing protein [Erythrobacter rubeus]|uniref:TonB-dependent receptor plug domain-containing protein n=1 Tax=Erythrobacter rubeus TaxID=2760803 RepID=A0ABR8KS98_9SPHN|nr:TonB-dependent receptor plug domain-containing protein [Erythrobacter rubeus]MBD2842225.1 TonB-dependent receptor plug domain-containing protein [Erythrobacter rubeus]